MSAGEATGEANEGAPAPRRPRVSLSTRVLIGLVLGIAAGVFLGERAAFLDPIGRGFVRLLQMSVLPYVAFSLIAGMGRLDAREARDIALRGGAVLLGLWGITLVFVALFQVSFPVYETASFFSSSLVEPAQEMDLLGLYIPANPFYALVHSIMPSIVLFSLAVGVALIALPGRAAVVEQIQVLADALMKVNTFAVSLAPYGVFALMAKAAGTITIDELARLQVFVIVYSGASLILALWVLPGLVAALTPLRYRQVIGPARDALVTGFATGSLLVVLPILSRQAAAMVNEGLRGSDESQNEEGEGADGHQVTDVLVPVSFNFPSGGKLLNLGFIVFAGWFSGSNLELSEYPVLLSVGTATFFGPNAMAVPYMLDLFRLPADLFQVFLAVDVLTGRFGVTVAVMHVLSLAVLAGIAIEGHLRVRPVALLRWALVTAGLAAAFFLGARLFFSQVIDLDSQTYQLFVEMDLHGESARVVADPGPPPARVQPTLTEIRETGVLRVCYAPDSLPFAFVNAKNRLVGYDVEVAHALARELGVGVYFERVERDEFALSLDSGRCHIVMSGFALTPERALQMSFSRPYLDNTLAFVVPDYQRHDWASWDAIASMDAPVIAVPNAPHYIRLLRARVPDARIQVIDSVRPFLRGELEGVDAMGFGAEAGGAWTLVYPSFGVVVPKPDPIGIPAAYAVRRGEWEWLEYLDTWLDLKRRDHFLDTLYEHWILGKHARTRQPRWSVIRDVLHVVE